MKNVAATAMSTTANGDATDDSDDDEPVCHDVEIIRQRRVMRERASSEKKSFRGPKSQFNVPRFPQSTYVRVPPSVRPSPLWPANRTFWPLPFFQVAVSHLPSVKISEMSSRQPPRWHFCFCMMGKVTRERCGRKISPLFLGGRFSCGGGGVR